MNIGDGEIQVVVANADLPKVEHWYRMLQEKCLSEGKEIKDFETIDMGQYRETGTMNEEAYVDTASGEMKEKLGKYEGQERGELEEKVLETENSIKSISNERYQELHNHPDYVEITINRETLIDQSRIAREKNPEVEAKGMFASRIPGTWGEKERTLVLPTDQVFQTDGGKTYLAFLAKNEKQILLDANGKPVSADHRPTGSDLYASNYEKVDRMFKKERIAADRKCAERSTQKSGRTSPAETSSHATKGDVMYGRKAEITVGDAGSSSGRIACYLLLLSGLTTLDGVTLANWQDKLLYVILHPLQNWWNDLTFTFLGIALIVWIGIVTYLMDYYRNRQIGVEYGSEQWADIKQIQRILTNKDETKNTLLSQNVAVDNGKLSNMNMLVIGNSGSYKSTSLVIPNALLASMTNVLLDIKGDLLRKTGRYLENQGVAIKVFNLINPEESDRWNPFVYIRDEVGLVKLITNLQESVKPPDAMKGEPFWDQAVSLYLMSLFSYEWLRQEREKKEHPEQYQAATLPRVLQLANLEMQQDRRKTVPDYRRKWMILPENMGRLSTSA